MGAEKEERNDTTLKVKEQEPLSRTLKIVTTCVIFFGNMTYGCAMNAFSPALSDFKKKFDADTSTVSIVFTASIGCYMVGALICSIIYNLINRQLAVVLLFVGITFSMIIAPHVPNLTLFYCVGGLLGFSIGCYDTAQFVWVMEMWQKDSAPLIQAQHFCFAVGTMLSPLIMSPFLTDEDEDDSGISTTAKPDKNNRLFIPFTLIGCLCALTATCQCLLFIFLRYRPPPPEKSTGDDDEDTNNNEKKENLEGLTWFQRQWPGWQVARLVILSMLVLGFYQGMEMSTMQLFPTFGQKCDLQLSESDAANTLTGLTGAFMIGRGLAIIFIFKIPPQIILFVDIGIVLVGNIILVIWANTSLPMLWTAGILYGLGFSSLLPSFCAYMERYLEFTNTIGAMMIVAGSGVGACYPVIIGSSIDETPLVLSYPIFFSIAMCTTAAVIASLITRKSKKRNE